MLFTHTIVFLYSISQQENFFGKVCKMSELRSIKNIHRCDFQKSRRTYFYRTNPILLLWGLILWRNLDESRKSFPPWYSQSFLLGILLPPPPLRKSCLKLVCNVNIGETSSLRTLKIIPRNLNEIACSWSRFQAKIIHRNIQNCTSTLCLIYFTQLVLRESHPAETDLARRRRHLLKTQSLFLISQKTS
jgi:hypothetical protein